MPVSPSTSLASAQTADWLTASEEDQSPLFDHMAARDDAAAIAALRKTYEGAGAPTPDGDDQTPIVLAPVVPDVPSPQQDGATLADILRIYDGWQPPAQGSDTIALFAAVPIGVSDDTALPPWSSDATLSDIIAIYDGWQPPAPGTTTPIVLGQSPVILTEVTPAGPSDAELLALYRLYDEAKPQDGGEPQVLFRPEDHATADTHHLDAPLVLHHDVALVSGLPA